MKRPSNIQKFKPTIIYLSYFVKDCQMTKSMKLSILRQMAIK